MHYPQHRREDLLARLDEQIEPLGQAATDVGAITSLAFMLTMGDMSRFRRGKQVAADLSPSFAHGIIRHVLRPAHIHAAVRD